VNFIIAAILAALLGLGPGASTRATLSNGAGLTGPVSAATPIPTDSPAPMPQDVVLGAGPS
jgi:hypothetical protein